MSVETLPNESITNKRREETLDDLRVVLEAKRIPEDERQGYIDAFTSKVEGETNEDIIDLVGANIMKDILERAKEIKAENSEVGVGEKEKACAGCGALNPSNANFCGQCGNKY